MSWPQKKLAHGHESEFTQEHKLMKWATELNIFIKKCESKCMAYHGIKTTWIQNLFIFFPFYINLNWVRIQKNNSFTS